MVRRIYLTLLALTLAIGSSFAENNYGLASSCQNGVILHCFNWTLNQIKNRLPEIAAAGYTSVQTSPLQVYGNGSEWYWIYDPYGFRVGNKLGSKDALRTLCAEADKYGIKVIVDVVANHLAGGTSGAAGYYSGIDTEFQNNSYWHSGINDIDYSNRYSITKGKISGLPDLNTESAFVQGKVKAYVDTLKACGVDGIRWDAAKHIGLPTDWDNASSNFWTNVLDKTLFNYGEVLDYPCSSDDGTLAKRYCNLMSITDNTYSNTVAGCINAGNLNFSYGVLTGRGCPDSKLVLWPESHDTYCNNSTSGYSVYNINKAWAIVGSRSGYTALYFSRPKGSTVIGAEGKSDWKDAEVVAVNHFHNAMVGQKEYFNIDNGTACILREKGCVLVKYSGSGSVSVANKQSFVASGTYKDEITGNTFTVTSSSISGTIGSTGIAVVYAGYSGTTPTPTDTTTTSKVDSTKLVLNKGEQAVFFERPSSWDSSINAYAWTGTTTVTEFTDAWPGSAATSIGGLVSKWTYTGSSTISGGLIFNDGTNQTSDFTWTNGGYYTIDGLQKTITASGDTTATNPTTGTWTVTFTKPSSWGSSINAYVYSAETGSVVELGKWPGKAMTVNSDGTYSLTFDLNIKSGYIIFNDGTNQTKGDPGFVLYNNGFYNVDGYDHSTVTSIGIPDGNVTNNVLGVFAHNGILYVNSAKACRISVIGLDGRSYYYQVHQGLNSIDSLAHGLYIVAHQKVIL
jgi:alpha-amylase